jgi:hypothetical protein
MPDMGADPHQVENALVTGHKDWRTLRRYTKLKPEELHKLQTAPQPSLEEFMKALATSSPPLKTSISSYGKMHQGTP